MIASRDHQVHRASIWYLKCTIGVIWRYPSQAVKVVGDPGIQTFKMMLYNMVKGTRSLSMMLLSVKRCDRLCGGETTVDRGYLSNIS